MAKATVKTAPSKSPIEVLDEALVGVIAALANAAWKSNSARNQAADLATKFRDEIRAVAAAEAS